MRGYCPRVCGEKRFPPHSFLKELGVKGDKILSVFVDESGMFKYPDPDSRFYIVGLVFHDQDVDIAPLVRQMDRSADELGLDVEFTDVGASPELAILNNKVDIVMGVTKINSFDDM